MGEMDKELWQRLAKSPEEKHKFLRMINVYVDVTAPLYFWADFDVFKQDVVTSGPELLHSVQTEDFTMDDFSLEYLFDVCTEECFLDDLLETLNSLKEAYHRYDTLQSEDDFFLDDSGAVIVHKDDIRKAICQMLPLSYNRTKNLMMSYDALRNIYLSKKDSSMDEWQDFCKYIEKLPLSELLTEAPCL